MFIMKPALLLFLLPLLATAQTVQRVTTTDGAPLQSSTLRLQRKAAAEPLLATGDSVGHTFLHWGTCFNELDLDALRQLPEAEQEQVMHDLFAPDGDLRLTRGRLTMNANDYSRAWYSCDTVSGDFQLRHFNIEHDRENVIPLIKMAQRQQPGLTFWLSPWSPPTWMKINHDYPVLSSRYNHQPKAQDYLLYDDGGQADPNEMQFTGERGGLFPRRLASQNYMIQDPRYLQAYARMFCRFIDLYREEGIPIDMVMYQNEAYSYTPYPGCAWTADGTIRFNRDYLAPTLQALHPDVRLYLGTFNTNRQDYVQHIVDALSDKVEGLGFQWEGRENLDYMRRHHPDLHMISSESECGNGSMDWQAGEHTFYLLHEYVGRGCDEYYIWNFILPTGGRSPWGWNQNALIEVRDGHARRTVEYYAVAHFSHYVPTGSRLLAFTPLGASGMQAIAFRRPDGRTVVIAGNTADQPQPLTVRLGARYLNATLPAHSFSTFTVN